MPPDVPPPERKWYSCSRLFKLLAVLCFVLVLLALLFPAQMGGRRDFRRRQAANDIRELVSAIKQYHIEYGRFPALNTPNIEDEHTQAQLIRILRGLDTKFNPRRVVFFETRSAHKSGSWRGWKYQGGLHPESGVLLDPWGSSYRIRLTSVDGEKIKSPYTAGEEISAPALVWSLGKDGVHGTPGKENILKDSDDVVSWR